MKIETQCLHSGYSPKNGEPRVVPIVQSTTYRFDSCDHVAALFDKPTEYMYSRFANPTCDAVEKKIAEMEGGVGCMLTSSGQAASLLSVLNLCQAGDSFIASSSIYGGTINLFGFTLKKLGIEVIWVDVDADYETILNAFKPNTKCVFGETLANPALTVFDFEKWANAAHKNNVPLIVDNTFATPYLCKPFEWGADIVVHSTTKYMDGHAVQGGGAIVDSGKFDWENAYKATGKFADMIEPDESYHGLKYVGDFGNMAYIVKARTQLMRDFGCYPSAQNAFYLNLGLETLAIRMPRYCENALKVAQHFKKSDKIANVSYPGLAEDKYNARAKKYMPKGTSGVVSISIKGGRKAAMRFMDALKLASDEVHVADIRTCVLHPASATHRQLSDEQLVAAGIDGGMVRFSCGLENIEDILEDIDRGLAAI
ncbi:MAG: O-acetylhomoserine aminocarboxypropyltransferase/cysteine synthase [Treponemataceae bacterium]|nr:O-acetylhomoserine aminocarboxypropyltransferase/cysteine synthase [Treponema sp.]MBD5412805.1 O-acetylhomoserine aminocarboxypropyltransferase/cysteine synthase [Treponema sp.]MDE7383722.1 O-acetylhomoserine aminocarboxypropyltransferase/cysteine synthase [Treponemataceae bacterium]